MKKKKDHNTKVQEEIRKSTAAKTKDTRPKILITSKIFVPKSDVDMNSIKKHYVTNIYEESSCRQCEYKADRHSYNCDSCPAFKKRVILFGSKVIQGKTYISLPIGDKKNVERKAKILLSDFKIVDKRTLSPFTYPIKFTATLRPIQTQLLLDFHKHNYGMIVAPPRTGKSITMLKACLDLGQRTVFLANQYEFLSQICDHIHGNEKEGIPKCTNLPELEAKHGKKLYGFPKTKEDYDNFQILFIPYQSLISDKKGAERLSWIKANFGTVAVDEVHRANADCFASVLSAMRTRYRIGCSGTLVRKDGLHFVMESIMGPANATTLIEALVPTVYVHLTEVEGRTYMPGPAAWVYAMQYLSGHVKRNKQIVEMVMKDLKNGHNIVIPVTFKKHVLELQNLINTAFGSHICGTFMGGGGKKNTEDRKELLTAAKENKIRVTVGIRSLLQLGLNVPSWSAIYEILPISNMPNLKQETARICTPKDGKRLPIIRLFVDINQPQSAGCARSSIGHMKIFNYNFAEHPKQKEILHEILSSGRAPREDPDDDVPKRTQKKSKGVTDDTVGLFKDKGKKRL